MSYIGKEPQVGAYNMLDSLTASATADYSLTLDSTAFVPESANHLLVSLNGVIQKAGSSFTVSGSTLSFSSALTSSDSIDFVLALGNVLDIGTPSDSTVTNAKTNFVSTSSAAGLQIKGDGTTDGTLQLNCSQNSHGVKIKSPAHSASASYTLTLPTTDGNADEFLKTDGSGVLSWGTAGGTNTPYFFASITSNQTLTHDTTTKINYDRADVDSASGYDTTNKRYTIPSGQGGYWHIGYSINIGVGANDKMQSAYVYPKKGGSADFPSFNSRHQGVAFSRQDGNPLRSLTLTNDFIVNLSASDYLEIFVNLGHSDGGSNTGSAGEYYSNFWGYKLAGA